MSSTTRQYFTSDDLNMLRRILDDAGLVDRDGETSRRSRSVASRFLIACFQQGVATEMELRSELFHHLYQDLTEPVRAGEITDFPSWENEGGAFGTRARSDRGTDSRAPGRRCTLPLMLKVAA
ncbi:MAG: hypothetical protein KL863_19725 [Rhizobium sp.]|nr:hypothetical protein [Rhizobium sp.]